MDTLITLLRARILAVFDKLILKKQSLIETINNQFKNVSNPEYSSHHSFTNFAIHVVAYLIAYFTHEACAQHQQYLYTEPISADYSVKFAIIIFYQPPFVSSL